MNWVTPTPTLAYPCESKAEPEAALRSIRPR